MDLDALTNAISATVPGSTTKLVAIDGRGGAGKSSLACELADRLDNTTVVAVDDFWLPLSSRPDRDSVISQPGADYDWHRLRDQVIQPLAEGRSGRYQRYDWRDDKLAEWHYVPAGGAPIVEGVFSIREELRDLYDIRVWVETPAAICLARGLERDGEGARDLWKNEWMRAYEQYIVATDPSSYANYILSGARVEGHGDGQQDRLF